MEITIFASRIIPDMTIRKRPTQTLEKFLQIRFTQRSYITKLTSLIINTRHNRQMQIVIGQRDKISIIMILPLHHETICPFAGIIDATTKTLTARDLDKFAYRLGSTITTQRHSRYFPRIARRDKLNMISRVRSYLKIFLTIRPSAKDKSL